MVEETEETIEKEEGEIGAWRSETIVEEGEGETNGAEEDEKEPEDRTQIGTTKGRLMEPRRIQEDAKPKEGRKEKQKEQTETRRSKGGSRRRKHDDMRRIRRENRREGGRRPGREREKSTRTLK